MTLRTFLGLTAAAAVLLLPSAASAARNCGTETGFSHGVVFGVTSSGVTCRTAKQVAGGWYKVQSEQASTARVFDAQGRRWRCRTTERATGTDPGYNPYTKVRCARSTSVVRFQLRS